MHRTGLRTPPVKAGTVTSTWMGPIRQVLIRISREYRDHDSITVQCPHNGRADTGLRFQAGPPTWHWENRRGELGWPVVHCCFCKRCSHAMHSYDLEDELPVTDGKPLDDYDAKAHEACYP